MLKLTALAIVASVFCLLLRQGERPLALVVSLLGCAVVLGLSLRFIGPAWEIAKQLQTLSGLDKEVTAPLLKAVGIGILTQIAGCVCTDAGEASLTKAVEISGTVLAVYVSLPLLSAVLSLVEKLLGGMG